MIAMYLASTVSKPGVFVRLYKSSNSIIPTSNFEPTLPQQIKHLEVLRNKRHFDKDTANRFCTAISIVTGFY